MIKFSYIKCKSYFLYRKLALEERFPRPTGAEGALHSPKMGKSPLFCPFKLPKMGDCAVGGGFPNFASGNLRRTGLFYG